MARKNKLYVNSKGDHYHRCEWCGVLMPCGDECLKGGPFDPYGPEDVSEDGVLPSCSCDTTCYNRERPQGVYHDRTQDGGFVTLPKQKEE